MHSAFITISHSIMSLIFAPGSPLFLGAFRGEKYAGVRPLSSIRLGQAVPKPRPEIDNQRAAADLLPRDDLLFLLEDDHCDRISIRFFASVMLQTVL